jgi:hypothetical protein
MKKALALAVLLSSAAIPAYADGMNVPPPLFGQGIGDTSSATTPGAGKIGEVLTAGPVAGVALTNSTVVNITSLSVTPGHWRCIGWMQVNPSSSSNVQGTQGGISTSNSAIPGGTVGFSTLSGTLAIIGAMPIGPVYENFTSTTTLFVNEEAFFSTGTAAGGGALQCERIW